MPLGVFRPQIGAMIISGSKGASQSEGSTGELGEMLRRAGRLVQSAASCSCMNEKRALSAAVESGCVLNLSTQCLGFY
jgi:hypothetical protein